MIFGAETPCWWSGDPCRPRSCKIMLNILLQDSVVSCKYCMSCKNLSILQEIWPLSCPSCKFLAQHSCMILVGTQRSSFTAQFFTKLRFLHKVMQNSCIAMQEMSFLANNLAILQEIWPRVQYSSKILALSNSYIMREVMQDPCTKCCTNLCTTTAMFMHKEV